MKPIDWIIHFITDHYGLGGTINSHTHGMERYGHMDFQLVLPYEPGEIGYLLNGIGQRVQSGERFAAGDMVSGLYLDCDIRLDLHIETGRQVLRLIVPDENNRFPENRFCMAPYRFQTQRMFEEAYEQ